MAGARPLQRQATSGRPWNARRPALRPRSPPLRAACPDWQRGLGEGRKEGARQGVSQRPPSRAGLMAGLRAAAASLRGPGDGAPSCNVRAGRSNPPPSPFWCQGLESAPGTWVCRAWPRPSGWAGPPHLVPARGAIVRPRPHPPALHRGNHSNAGDRSGTGSVSHAVSGGRGCGRQKQRPLPACHLMKAFSLVQGPPPASPTPSRAADVGSSPTGL